ncbi:protein-tyrosine phosphatase-like protein [Lyophyllum atratum]|nr:protein-tyrosine phosphatase-like protein [Lyophyllum atratum]
MSPSEIPPWLAKHSSNTYLLSVYRCLQSREEEREAARYIPRPTHTEPSRGTPSARRSQAQQFISKFLRSQSPTQKNPIPPGHYSVAVGQRPDNHLRNRYLDIHPYDRTRVVLNVAQGEEEGKYLNASWVLENYGQKWWIASQASLPNTAHTFLSILLQSTTSPPASLLDPAYSSLQTSRVRTVVQLTSNIENGRRKAHPYFPSDVGQSTVIQPEGGDTPALKVILLERETIEEAHCTRSIVSLVPVTLKSKKGTRRSSIDGTKTSDTEEVDEDEHEYSVVDGRETITFQHMFYTSWPDHGVPHDDDRASLLAFLRLVDSTNRDTSLATSPDDPQPDPDPPIIVGCSAGIGRTGSFIALSSLLRKYGFLPPPGRPSLSSALPPCPLDALPSALSEDLVVQEVDSMREQRPGMVQRNEQIRLIYEVLTSAFVL